MSFLTNPLIREEMLQELIDNIPDVIYFKDKKGVLTFVNKAHAQGLGLHPEDVIGKTDYDFFPKGLADGFTIDDQRVMETKIPVIDKIEYTIQPDGSQHVVSTTKLPRYDYLGRVCGIMGISRDITSRTCVEETLKMQQERSERKLRKLNDALDLEKSKLEKVLSIEEGLTKIFHMEKLIDFVVTQTAAVLEVSRCSLMLYDQNNEELCIRGHLGLDEEIVTKSRLKKGESIAGKIAQEGKPILVENIEKDARFYRKNRSSYNRKSFMGVPITLDDRLLGVICVADKDSATGMAFNEVDLRTLNMIARQVAIAIENARLYRKLNYLTITDPLTNIYNYRYFARSLDHEISRMNRYTENLCLMMLDIDHFKTYNDIFGHVEGDKLLKEISKVLHGNLREVDIACRYAGDEFVVILPETTLESASAVAEKIKFVIHNLKLKMAISVSIGIASCKEGMDRHDLVLRADSALYEAKNKGRNCVCCYGS